MSKFILQSDYKPPAPDEISLPPISFVPHQNKNPDGISGSSAGRHV